jgi:hypothetical protein
VSGIQARLESSVLGRLLISLGVTVTVVAVLVVDMPASHLRDRLIGPAGWFVRATGLDQDWGVFAPPPTISFFVEGRVDDADGTTSVWANPLRPGLGTYVDYRWHKYEERLRLDDEQRLWAPYARYLADQARAAGHTPVRVSLVRRWASTRPPGPGPEHGPWQEYTFFVLPVAA